MISVSTVESSPRSAASVSRPWLRWPPATRGTGFQAAKSRCVVPRWLPANPETSAETLVLSHSTAAARNAPWWSGAAAARRNRRVRRPAPCPPCPVYHAAAQTVFS